MLPFPIVFPVTIEPESAQCIEIVSTTAENVWNSRGWALYELEHYIDAKECFRKASALGHARAVSALNGKDIELRAGYLTASGEKDEQAKYSS